MISGLDQVSYDIKITKSYSGYHDIFDELYSIETNVVIEPSNPIINIVLTQENTTINSINVYFSLESHGTHTMTSSKIEHKISANSSFISPAATLTSSPFTISGLERGESYDIKITKSYSDESYSDTISIRTTLGITPSYILGINHEWRQTPPYGYFINHPDLEFQVKFSWSSIGTHGNPEEELIETRVYYLTGSSYVVTDIVTSLPDTYEVVTNGIYASLRAPRVEGSYLAVRLVKVYKVYGLVIASIGFFMTQLINGITRQYYLPSVPHFDIAPTIKQSTGMRIWWIYQNHGSPTEDPVEIRLYYNDSGFWGLVGTNEVVTDSNLDGVNYMDVPVIPDQYFGQPGSLPPFTQLPNYTNEIFISDLIANTKYYFMLRTFYTFYRKSYRLAERYTAPQFPQFEIKISNINHTDTFDKVTFMVEGIVPPDTLKAEVNPHYYPIIETRIETYMEQNLIRFEKLNVALDNYRVVPYLSDHGFVRDEALMDDENNSYGLENFSLPVYYTSSEYHPFKLFDANLNNYSSHDIYQTNMWNYIQNRIDPIYERHLSVRFLLKVTHIYSHDDRSRNHTQTKLFISSIKTITMQNHNIVFNVS
jgi:hypothetical protein